MHISENIPQDIQDKANRIFANEEELALIDKKTIYIQACIDERNLNRLKQLSEESDHTAIRL